MLAKEPKPQAHSPSLRSIKHCDQPVLSQRRAQNSSRNERKKPKLLPAISPKRRRKQKAEQESKERQAKTPRPSSSDFAQKEGQSKKRSKKQKRKQKLPTAISPKGRIKQEAEQESKGTQAKTPRPSSSDFAQKEGQSKKRAQESKKAQAKASPAHSNFTQREKKARKQKPHLPTQRFRPKGEERRASQRKNSVLSFKAKSGEAEHGEKKRRLFERSEFLRFRRVKPRSRLEAADGGFSFCYLFLFAAKKKK